MVKGGALSDPAFKRKSNLMRLGGKGQGGGAGGGVG